MKLMYALILSRQLIHFLKKLSTLKIVAIFLLTFLFNSIIFSQVYTGNYTIILQADALAFQSAGYVEVTGDLIIGGDINDPDHVYDLGGLSSLITIGGDLHFETTNVTDFMGLQNVTSIGGDFYIGQMTGFQNFNNLTGLQTITGSLVLSDANTLNALTGMTNLTSLGGINTTMCYCGISSFAGLEGITSISGDVIIADIGVGSPPNFQGLHNLQTIGGKLEILNIDDLIDLSGFDMLTAITGNLKIDTGPFDLTEISAFANLLTVGGDLIITNNMMLDECCGLYPLLNNTGVSGIITISNNLSTGDCNSSSSIISNCVQLCPAGNITFATQTEIDDFLVNYPNCTMPLGDITIEENGTPAITNLDGLINIVEMTGSLTISNNPTLSDIDGLANLTKVGQLTLLNNPMVSDLGDLANLDQVTNNLTINMMAGLTASLGSLSSLDTVGGDLEILDCDNMTSFNNGIDAVELIGGTLKIDENALLSDFTVNIGLDLNGLIITNNPQLGFCSYDPICNYLGCQNTATISNNQSGGGCNSVTELKNSCNSGGNSCCPVGDLVFNNQTEIDDFIINYPNCTIYSGSITITETSTPAITNLNGLGNLQWMTAGNLTISGNPSLPNLSGLNSLYNAFGLYISNNSGMTDFSGALSLSTISNLDISQSNLTDLTGFSILENINTFNLHSSSLTSLDGLDKLFQLDNLFLTGNTSLTDIDILEYVNISYTEITGNTQLSNCSIYSICNVLNCNNFNVISGNNTGCNSVAEVSSNCSSSTCCPYELNFYSQADITAYSQSNCSIVPGNVSINGTDITDLTPLSTITEIGGDLQIFDCTILTTLDGLSGLTKVGGNVFIGYNAALVDIGLDALVSVDEYCEISNNNLMVGLSGLGNLTTVNEIYIVNNPELVNLNSLPSLTTIQTSILINGNPKMTSLSGLEAVTTFGGSINISGNAMLSDCAVSSICAHLDNGGSISASTNLTGCNSQTEVETACIDEPFITTWETTTNGESITIPTDNATYTYDYTIDWGDGSTIETNQTGDATHSYTTAGTYTVEISGDFPHFKGQNTVNKTNLKSIEQWGSIAWESMEYAFSERSNMVYNATDAPDLSGVTSMRWMFNEATSFDGDLNSWDVSNVTDMGGVFNQAHAFNGNISDWNVLAVTDMLSMFFEAINFNGDISSWDVDNVTNMNGMFSKANNFDGNLSTWKVGNVNNMHNMFRSAGSFTGTGGLTNWDVTTVQYMGAMFYDASNFNGDISSWNVGGVLDMNGMFYDASSFDQDLSGWDVTLARGTNTASGYNGMQSMLDNSGMSVTNYDNALIAWAALNAPSRILGAAGLEYCAGQAARQTLLGQGWTVSGDTFTPNCCTHLDFDALEAFYTSTNGASWNNNTGWLQNCDPCGINGTPWFGIDCTNNNNRVRNIFMPNNNLTGTLPPEIGGLEMVNWINLDLNNIGGTIPTEICQLTNLGHLIISRNPNLTGSIPNCFANNFGFAQMVLHGCNLTGALPDFGANNNNLIIIHINDNNFTGTIPSSWGNIPSLNNGFLIQNNNLSGAYDPLLQNLCPLTMTNAFVSDGNNFNEPWEDFCDPCPPNGILYVNESATGNNNGASWANAYTDFQNAVDFIANNPTCTPIEIWVASGVYYPSEDSQGNTGGSNLNKGFFINTDCKIIGGFPNTGNPTMNDRDWVLHPTIFSGDIDVDDDNSNSDGNFIAESHTEISGNNSRVLVLGGTEDINSEIDGLIFTGSSQSGIHCQPYSSTGSDPSSYLKVRNCLFQGNTGINGGGINSRVVTDEFIMENPIFSNPEIENCQFINNYADQGGAINALCFNGQNYVIDIPTAEPKITNCIFEGNTSLRGGAIYSYASSKSNNSYSIPKIVNSLFFNNSAVNDGGAIYCLAYDRWHISKSIPEITNSTFYNNSADKGGAIYSYSSSGGSGVASSPTISNSIFWQNSASQGNEIYNYAYFTPVWAYLLPSNGITIENSLVESADCNSLNVGVNTTINCSNMVFGIEPLFVDAPNLDFSLQQCSPAVNTGTNTNAPVNDLLGNTRPYVGTTSIADMGAYEYQGDPLASIAYYPDGDIDTYGDMNAVPLYICQGETPPSGMVTNNLDCDDGDITIYTGATELCNGIDEDCDGYIDEALNMPFTFNYNFQCLQNGDNVTVNWSGGCPGWKVRVTLDHIQNNIIVSSKNNISNTGSVSWTIPSNLVTGTYKFYIDYWFNGSAITWTHGPQFFIGDSDGDGLCDLEDNCPNDANPLQEDVNNNGIGDICETCPASGIIYVNQSATGINDGKSWADAFTNLQSALDLVDNGSCSAGTEIRVAQGIYLPTKEKNVGDPRSKTFYFGTDLEIYGGYDPAGSGTRDIDLYPTILSGDLDGGDVMTGIIPEVCISIVGNGNAFHVVYIDKVSAAFELEGFIIVSGNADGTLEDRNGGGIYIDGTGSGNSCNPNIKSCVISGNNALLFGGGIFNYSRYNGNTNTLLDNITIYCNSAGSGGGLADLAWEGSSAGNINTVVTNSNFKWNTGGNGGGYTALGNNTSSFDNVYFAANSSTSIGGAIYNNTKDGSNQIRYSNCVFSGNKADSWGGAIYNQNYAPIGGCSPTFSFCTITGNYAGVNGIGAAIYNQLATPTYQNSIIWGNSNNKSIIDNIPAGSAVKLHNIIQNDFPLDPTTKDLDPLFVSMPDYNNAPTTTGDLRLQSCSPAIDAGNAQTSPTEDIEGNIRPSYVDHDWGAYEYVGAPCGVNRIYVDKDATGGNNDGTSWVDAYTNFQTAIDDAFSRSSVAEIWVSEGVYYPTKTPSGGTSPLEDRTFYINEEVKLFGGFDGTETNINQRNIAAHPTILSGDVDGNDMYTNANEPDIIQDFVTDILGDNSYHIMSVYLSDVESPVIDGFIFTAGNGNGATFPRNFGGGVIIQTVDDLPNKSVDINNCQFIGNFAKVGAGMAVHKRTRYKLILKVSNTKFYHNFASNSGGAYYSYHDKDGRSGIKIHQSFINCQFISNSSGKSGGAMTVRNFSPYYGHSKIDLINCLFASNSSRVGAGIYLHNEVKARSQIFPTIINSTFVNNSAEYGGAVYYYQRHTHKINPLIYNSIFWGNVGNTRGDLFDGYNHSSTISNSLLQSTNCNSAVTGGSILGGNSITCSSTLFNQDPLFVDMDGADNILGTLDDDYRIATNSPGVDAGDITYLPADEYDLDDDGDVAENIPYDLIGSVREFGTDVDMGAMEYDGNYLTSTPPVSSFDNPNSTEPQDDNNTFPPPNNSGNILENSMYMGMIYVDKDASGNNDGTSWTDAFNDVQDGITAAQSGDQIWVAEGVYYPTQDTTGSFTPLEDYAKTFYINEDIQIYGGFVGTETMLLQRNPTTYVTILSGDVDMDDENTDGNFIAENTGDINGLNAAHVVYFDAVGNTCLLDGFTITAGEAKLMPFGSFAAYHDNGGGIMVYGSGVGNSCSPNIRTCKFYGNFADNSGGAIYNYGNLDGIANPTIEDCYFEGNEAQFGGGVANEGVEDGSAFPVFLNNQFVGNYAVDGGAFSTYGLTQVQMDSCQFESNFAGDNGGAMFISGADSLLYSSQGTYGYCTFKANEAGNDGGAIFTTAVDKGTVATLFVNSLFSGNYAANYGGSIYNDGQDGTCEPKFFNCTFSGNRAQKGGGAITNHYASPKLYNNILWGNSSEILDGASTPTAEYNLIQNGYLLDVNAKSADPNFVTQPDFNNAPTNVGNFHLGANSDAIDAGHNPAIDTLGLTVDLAENARLFDGNGNSTATIDLGVYEFLGALDYYPDVDGDTFGDINSSPLSVPNTIDPPSGYLTDNTDCDDSNNTIHPNATEICDNLDNNCSGLVDMNDPNLEDFIKPTPIVFNSPIQVVLPPNTETILFAVDFDAGSYDNCGIASMSLSQMTFSCGDIGMNNVDFTVLDVNGNSESITIVVDVIDPQGNCNCDGDNVTLNNSSPFDPLIMAGVDIVSDATVAINTTVIYQATQDIRLDPNFVAEAGSDFTAKIEDCTSPTSIVEEEEIPSYSESSITYPENSIVDVEIPTKEIMMSISPNPFNKNAFIEFTLPEKGEASLGIYTLTGQLIQVLVDGDLMDKGRHQFELNGDKLPKGMMYFKLEQAGETVVKKMIRVD